MIKYLRARKRLLAISCLSVFALQLFQPTVLFALTSGPTQPEVQAFQPAGTTDMVDLFSGDFSYNIPLFELPGPNGGYPFNLSYQAGIGMDQEASWVGLGWSLNPGAITRQMRGLPDEFKGDLVKTKMSIKPSVTVGLGAGAGVEIFGGDGSLGFGFSVSQNNYKGFGYSVDASLGFHKSMEGGKTGGIGLNVSLDSREGINVQPSLSLKGELGEFGLSAGYNSKSGLSSLSISHEMEYVDKAGKQHASKGSISASSSISLAHPGYTPQITMPMKNINLSAQFKPGGSWWGIFGNLYVRGFYNQQYLDKDDKVSNAGAYGYMHYQSAPFSESVLDFNREKDGLVTKETPNLGIPSLTYDIYSVTGQGIGAMYRPMRNDYGFVFDQETTSVTNGGSIGVDVAPTASHVGVNLSVNHGESTSGAWVKNNPFAETNFEDAKLNYLYEPWYFKVHGEPAVQSSESLYAKLGGDRPVRVKLSTGNQSDVSAIKGFEFKTSAAAGSPSLPALNQNERESRNQVIQTFTNEQLLSPENKEVLPYFIIKDAAGNIYNRSGLPKQHLAGFTALTTDGLRYNYGLPAYNHKQVEVTFSAEKIDPRLVSRVLVNAPATAEDPKYKHASETDEMLKSVELPAFAHSHLLTSILGPDYVDLTGNGVTDDDLGYWVRFTYAKKSSNYKWRDPFSKAHYNEGWKTDPRDDKGSFVYGEKELWFLAKAETKSHIAEFTISGARGDGKGVAAKLQDVDNTGETNYKLTEIKLYSRLSNPNTDPANAPIKIVKFKYFNDEPSELSKVLCKGLYNGNTGVGKLTLKSLSFQYGNSTRALNPYTFTYSSENPDYDNLKYDRWGNYKPYPAGDINHNRDFPYVPQSPALKDQLGSYASAWSLTEIQLPSGGKIKVDYECDDYAYVQHKPAMQMMEILDPVNGANTSDFLLGDGSGDLVKVRFKLESPIYTNFSNVQAEREQAERTEAMKYLDLKRKQIYFKIQVNLRKPGSGYYEYISGYADLENPAITVNGATQYTVGLETANGLGASASNPYTYGFFHLKKEQGNGDKHHPFSLRAWQHLRSNQPELLGGRNVKQSNDAQTRVNQIKSMAGMGGKIREMFQGFYNYCRSEGVGRQVKLGKSWVRLNSPDKVKFGGGLRVRQITMTDEWSEDKEGIYGQVYEYTMTENNAVISSGVAAYEPMVGGEENPLKYAKKYVQSVPLHTDNMLFFEYPINESYYPGAQVGYRKVTVWSLPSAYRAGKDVRNISFTVGTDPASLFPANASNIAYGTSGKTEHEFYTAKDFPVITDETEKIYRPYRLSIPVPLLGSLAISKFTASQGYSIVTNDMHGKPRKVSNYRQDKSGNTEAEAMSWVQYNYRSVEKIYDGEKVNALVNNFTEIPDGQKLLTPAGTSGTFTLGQETEFFMDMREYRDLSYEGGARINTDVVYIPVPFALIPVPLPTVWPSIGKTDNLLRTAVTNKVIFKSGIIESTDAYDGGSRIRTQNLKWDKRTGAVVVTAVNNNFDDLVYNYNILAHTQYEGMGAAYRNVGLVFEVKSIVKDPYKPHHYDFFAPLASGTLWPGDEIVLYPHNSSEADLTAPVAKAIYMGKADGDNILYCEKDLSAQKYKGLIVRSGFRNQLSVSAGSITGLQDPSVKGDPVTYPKTITIVK
jgi:hypothetical protein